LPCDSLRIQRADYKNADLATLRAALIRAGLSITSEDTERGYLSFRDPQTYRTGQFRNGAFLAQEGIDLENIKREYSCEAVERAAKKFAFSYKAPVKTKSGSMLYAATRRSF